MPNQSRQRAFSRARLKARRQRQLILGAIAAGVVIAVVILLALPKGKPAEDRAVTAANLAEATATPAPAQVEDAEDLSDEALPAEEEAGDTQIVFEGEAEDSESEDDGLAALTAAAPSAAPSATPAPASNLDPVTSAARAATRPTPTAPGFIPVFSKADTEEKIIAITVDDCFQPTNLRNIVDKALEVGGKLTIFPIGQNVLKEKIGPVVKYAWEQGMEIENHTFHHSGLYRCSDEDLAKEIFLQQMTLSYTFDTEYHCHFLRPRGGDARKDQRLQKYAEQMGYYGIAHWSCTGSTSTEHEIAKALKPGTIYLFHTTNSDWAKLEKFIPWAVEQGYQLVTLNEMFGYPDNETSPLTMDAQDYPVPTLAPYDRVYVSYKKTTYAYGVYLLQEKLIELGYMSGEPDGVYGGDCANAVKKYQADHGLEQTGVADPELQAMIFES